MGLLGLVFVAVWAGMVWCDATELPPADAISAADSLDSLVDIFFTDKTQEQAVAPNVPKGDGALSWSQKRERMKSCFELTQMHLTTNRNDYSKTAREAAVSKGLREDDALRLFFHSTVVACYNNMQESDWLAFKSMSLTEADTLRILWRDKSTPYQFSEAQYNVLSEIMGKFQQEDATRPDAGAASGWLTLSGTMGALYIAAIVAALASVLFFAVRRLMKLRELKNKPQAKKALKTERKKAK